MSDKVVPIRNLDCYRRFLFENMDVRGECLHFEQGLTTILRQHQYPSEISGYLAEFVLAAVLLTGSLKFKGRLSLQLQGPGPVGLMIAECSSERQVRALARYSEASFMGVQDLGFKRCFAEATLAIMIEPEQGERYQGVVPLEGESLADCLQFYFQQSEQLQSSFFFAVEQTAQGIYRGAALMMQQLPVSQKQKVITLEARQEQWDYVSHLLSTLTGEEMLNLPVEQLLYRLFHQDDLRLFDAVPVRFSCSCSRAKYLQALLGLGSEVLQEILQEQGAVVTQCEFCSANYKYGPEDLADL